MSGAQQIANLLRFLSKFKPRKTKASSGLPDSNVNFFVATKRGLSIKPEANKMWNVLAFSKSIGRSSRTSLGHDIPSRKMRSFYFRPVSMKLASCGILCDKLPDQTP